MRITFLTNHRHDKWIERQPDGGKLELCVRIVMTTFHSTDHWHDVPCASDKEVSQYICMKPTQGKRVYNGFC